MKESVALFVNFDKWASWKACHLKNDVYVEVLYSKEYIYFESSYENWVEKCKVLMIYYRWN